MSFVDPNLPQIGRCATKSSFTCTFIAGSSAAGETLPPHLQFSTSATSEERERMHIVLLTHVLSVFGKFGYGELKELDTTIGVNENGGMDDKEFEKYLLDLIDTIFPDAEDKVGKRIIVSIDSGPGRSNTTLLARLLLRGVLLYTGVPSTTSVSQETDRNYGLFKSKYRVNLSKFATDGVTRHMSTSSNISHISLFVFGGEDQETGCTYENAF